MKKRTASRRLSKTEAYIKEETDAYINLCFAMMEDWTWSQIVKESDLSLSCLRSLYQEGFKRGTRHLTIQKLGKAAGLMLEWVEGQPRLKLVA